MSKQLRLEIRLTPVEKAEFITGQTKRKERYLAEHVKKCALKQNDEYIKYQFNDKPAPLSERMNWDKPVMASKEDLQNG